MDESRRRGATRDDLLRLFGHHREGVSAEEDDETSGEGYTDEELEVELDAELEDLEAELEVELEALGAGMD